MRTAGDRDVDAHVVRGGQDRHALPVDERRPARIARDRNEDAAGRGRLDVDPAPRFPGDPRQRLDGALPRRDLEVWRPVPSSACACHWYSGPTPAFSKTVTSPAASRHTTSRPAAGGSCGVRPSRTIQRTRIRSRTRVPTSPSPRSSRWIVSRRAGTPASGSASLASTNEQVVREIQVGRACSQTASARSRRSQATSSAADTSPSKDSR